MKSLVDTFLYLPNTGRLSAGTGIRYVPKMSAPAASFVFVSSTSASIGAAFDVFSTEPPEDDELLLLDNFFATPHLGGSSHEAILAMGMAAIDGLDNCSIPD